MNLAELLSPFVRSPLVSTLWILNLLLAVAVAASFAWGSLAYLRFADVREPRKRLLAISVYLGLAAAVAVIVFWPQPVTALLGVGIGFFIVSLYFFFGAVAAHRHDRPGFAFVKTPPISFVSHGPYRFVRHPIYTSYLLAFFALTCLSAVPVALLAALWLGWMYYLAAREEEQSFDDSLYAEEYEAYRARTGMFFPRPRFFVRRQSGTHASQ